jgi:hypothetical protein
MGYIPLTGKFKFWANGIVEDGITDFNSVQLAVQKTLENESLATKNFTTLCSLARLDLFDPKRTTLPNTALQFRGFPRPTVDSFNVNATMNNTSLTIIVTGQLNNKVGYNILLGNRAENTYSQVRDGIITNHQALIPSGTTSINYSFGWEGDYSLITSVEVEVTILSSDYPIYRDVINANNPYTINVNNSQGGSGTGENQTLYFRQKNNNNCTEGDWIDNEFTQFRIGNLVNGTVFRIVDAAGADRYYKYGSSSGFYTKLLHTTIVLNNQINAWEELIFSTSDC